MTIKRVTKKLREPRRAVRTGPLKDKVKKIEPVGTPHKSKDAPFITPPSLARLMGRRA